MMSYLCFQGRIERVKKRGERHQYFLSTEASIWSLRRRKWYLQIWQMREGYRETLYQGHSNMVPCAEIQMKSTGMECLNYFVVFPRERNANLIFSWYRWLRATEQNSKCIRGWNRIHSRPFTDVIILKKCHLAPLYQKQASIIMRH